MEPLSSTKTICTYLFVFIPFAIQSKYHLRDLDQSKSIMFEIACGMYGLVEAGRLAQDRLIAHLDSHCYYVAANTPCLSKHRSRSTIFSLVVDDFGIKFGSQADADHLLSTLRLLYNITVDVTGSQHLGMSIVNDTRYEAVSSIGLVLTLQTIR